MSQSSAAESLDKLFDESLHYAKGPIYPKIGTIKAMVDLGPGWHTYSEIQKELFKTFKTGNNYVFQLARLYPEIIELNDAKEVRIKLEALPSVKRVIGRYAKTLLEAIKNGAK